MTLASHVWGSGGGCISQIAVEEERVGGGTEVAGIDNSFEKFVGGIGVDTCHSFWLPSNCFTSLCLGISLPMNITKKQRLPPTSVRQVPDTCLPGWPWAEMSAGQGLSIRRIP